MIHTTENFYIWDNWEVDQYSDITYRLFMQDQNGNWAVIEDSLFHGDMFEPFDWWLIILGIALAVGVISTYIFYRTRRLKQQEAAIRKLKATKGFLADPIEKLQTMKDDWHGFLKKYLDPDSKTIQLALRSPLSPESIAIIKEEQDKAILEATKAIENEDIKAAIKYLETSAKFAEDLGDTTQSQLVLTKIKEMKMILDALERRT